MISTIFEKISDVYIENNSFTCVDYFLIGYVQGKLKLNSIYESLRIIEEFCSGEFKARILTIH